MDDSIKLLELLAVLSSQGLKFKTKDGDTILIANLQQETKIILTAILEAQPNEFGDSPEGYRLWWD